MALNISGFSLDYIRLINYRGDVKDITQQFDGIELNEDLYAPCCHGEIVITDAIDLQQEFPLIGEERLQIRYRTTSEMEWVEREFYVYELQDRIRQNNAFTYTLTFVSKEYITTKINTVTASWDDKNVTDIVKALFKYFETDKELDAIACNNTMTYIAPCLNPIQAIMQLLNRASTDAYKGSAFVFYEDADGYKFTTVEKLMEGKEITYNVIPSAAKEGMDSSKFYSVKEFHFVNQFNELDLLEKGMYGSLLWTIDPLTRTIKSKEYNYFDTFDKFKHVEGKESIRFNSDKFPWKDKVATTLVKSCLSNAGKKESAYIKQNSTEKEHSYITKEDTLQYRLSQLQQYTNNVRLRITVPGNSQLRCGNILKLAIPSQSQFDRDDPAARHDKYVSGKYIVNSVKHVITKRAYESTLELSKDCYKEDYEDGIREEFFGK